jgi:hypothetical protein
MTETPEEKARRLGVPLIPKVTRVFQIAPISPNQVVSVCGECGLEMRQVMGYVCSRGADCPTGLGGLTFSTGLSGTIC